jgi:hypothetical protein
VYLSCFVSSWIRDESWIIDAVNGVFIAHVFLMWQVSFGAWFNGRRSATTMPLGLEAFWYFIGV